MRSHYIFMAINSSPFRFPPTTLPYGHGLYIQQRCHAYYLNSLDPNGELTFIGDDGGNRFPWFITNKSADSALNGFVFRLIVRIILLASFCELIELWLRAYFSRTNYRQRTNTCSGCHPNAGSETHSVANRMVNMIHDQTTQAQSIAWTWTRTHINCHSNASWMENRKKIRNNQTWDNGIRSSN